ncbi:MAG: amidohydrolase family protein [Blautia sp.]|nr:amidohydrolase family protein [Blautia sp.]MDY5031757.1 amidohydrolase family protein [Blautia sp.]
MDFLIRNGCIVNGKNETPYMADIAVANGGIQKIAPAIPVPEDLPQDRVLDAAGAYVTPGFIDIHRHGDWEALRAGDDQLLNRQGITTVVNGNCGLSVAPAGDIYYEEIQNFLSSVTGAEPKLPKAEMRSGRCLEGRTARSMGEYMNRLADVRRSVNTGMLVGNGTLRAGVKGYAAGTVSSEEIRQIQRNLEEALEAGALGVSLGIAYAPEFSYHAEELVRVLEPVRGKGIPLVTHVRSEGDGLLNSLREVICVAEALEAPLHVSHMKCIGKRNWNKTVHQVLKLFEQARERGVQIDFDVYPYLTGSTQLVHVLPPAFQEGGTEQILRRLSDRTCREELEQLLKEPSEEFENIVELAGYENIFASTLHSPEYLPYAGQSILEIAKIRGMDPCDTLCDILIREKCQVTMLDTIASEQDMLTFLKDPHANLISDAIYPAGGKYHPRVYGAFPRFLIEYVKKKPVFSIEEAIWKMTAGPANVLGLKTGVLEEGRPADINVFRLEELMAPADFREPQRLCSGFACVLVNGEPAVRKDSWNNTGTGKVCRK